MLTQNIVIICTILGTASVVYIAVKILMYGQKASDSARESQVPLSVLSPEASVVPSQSSFMKNHVEADRRALTVEFLNLHALALERFDATLGNVRRKLSAGQTSEVHRMLSQDTLFDDHTKMFNQSFDRVIYNLYPHFIAEVNKFLIPDKRIEKPENNRLTTELRILAFACIGIDDTTVIARFLGLSHNTIYTYRNRMRARALNRETFDENIQHIGMN